jgi:predicted esterase
MNQQATAQMCPPTIDHDGPQSPESKLLRCAIQTCPDRARAANPMTYASADDPPFFLSHGDRDCAVPWRQSQILHDTLVSRGLDSHFRRVPGGAHTFGSCAVQGEMLAFFERTLKQ